MRFWFGLASLAVAAAIWLPVVHWLYRKPPAEFTATTGIPPRALELAERQIRIWRDPAETARAVAALRATNPEWDLMSRGYFVLALANMTLRDPAERQRNLDLIDRVIDDTLAAEREDGQAHFLLPYVHRAPFVARPARSLHVDSQIGLMLGARCVLEPREDYVRELGRRVEIMQTQMAAGPVLMAESYPDECWLFDNANAIVVMRMLDAVGGTNHAEFILRWRTSAVEWLRDPKSGLLASSLTSDGKILDGPEGSTLWMAMHALQLVDPDLARSQYDLARQEIGRTLLGFGYAREWPEGWVGPGDVDSGPPIPILGVSAGSSGTAFIAASAFHDTDYLVELFTTLDFAGFPRREDGALQYCASNQLGDAVVLYAIVLGPLWDRVAAGGAQ